MGYLYILLTIIFTVYGQLILKWRLIKLNWNLETSSAANSIISYFKLLLDPFIISGFVSAFIASLFWILAMTKFEITYAYPFMSIAPALVFLLGVFVLGETFTLGKLIGLFVIIAGIIITVKL